MMTKRGKSSDDVELPEGQQIINQPVAYPGQGPLVEPEPAFTLEEIQAFRGEVEPGHIGYLELGEDGEPTGSAVVEAPEHGKTYARVFAPVLRQLEELVTPSGAPITRHMNPQPEMWDEGMLQRNPPGGTWQPPEHPDYTDKGSNPHKHHE